MATRADLVTEFYEAAGFDPTLDLRLQLVHEELAEVKEALENLLKEMADLQYVCVGLSMSDEFTDEQLSPELEDASLLMSAITDLYGPVIVDEAFRRVHESNMSKLTDGKLVRDPDTGKVLKGPNYKAPDLSDLI